MVAAAFMVPILLALVLGLLVIRYLSQLQSYWRYRTAVNKIPDFYGRIPIFGNLFQVIGPMNQFFDRLEQDLKKSKLNSIFWFGPIPCLILTDPDFIEIILHSSMHIAKLFEYKLAKPWVGEGLATSKGPKWAVDRKMLAPTFHLKILQNFLQDFNDKGEVLVTDLEEKIGSTSFNIYPYISKCVMDIVCATMMGNVRQEQDTMAQYTELMSISSKEIMYRGLRPWLHSDIIYKFLPSGKKMAKCTEMIHEISREALKERKEQAKHNTGTTMSQEDTAIGKKSRLAFLDNLLRNKEEGLSDLTDEDIREQVDTFMFAAHDTGTSLLTWCLQMLSSHPDIQEMVFQEQADIFKGSDRPPNMTDINQMKYLERVIKETLRLYPSVPIYGRQLEEDVKMGDYVVPKGMRVIICPYLTHRLEKYFPNPNEFDPDRFLPERFANIHPFAYIPFSAGPRNCIGWKYAMIQVKCMLSYIMRHYKLQSTTQIPKPIPALVIRPENGVHLKITKRVTYEM